MVRTEVEIEAEVLRIGGTWVKHRNTRRKLINSNNTEIHDRIDVIKKEVRLLKLDGFNEQDCRKLYANITKLELQLL